jgi:WD40 repeat protein
VSYVSCRALFQNKAKLGQDSALDMDSLWTSHEGAISSINTMGPGRLSTAGLDGNVVVWDLPQLDIAMASLGL